VKPANILVTPEGRVKVADFGIARFADSEASHTVLGTPAYMAPEQLHGGRVDARSDIFSAGAMLYWMVTGQKAFPGEDLASVSFRVAYTDPRRPSEIDPDLPADLDTVISRCLAKNRADRYPTARSLALDLQLIAAGEPIGAMPASNAGELEKTVTATLPLTSGPFVTAARVRPAVTKERPLNRGLVTAAILVLTLAVIAIPTRQVERIFLIPTPWRSADTAAPVLPEEKQVEEVQLDAVATPPPKVERPAVLPPVDRTPVRSLETLKPPVSTVRPGPIETVTPPAEPSVAAADKPLAAGSALFFECKHNFRNATLSISSDGKELELTMLEKKGIWFASSGGRVENQTPLVLPAGTRELRVRVRSNDEKKPFDQEASIEGTFPEHGSLRLRIEFPKDRLRLSWAGD
jgi:hypothetical protein